MGIAMEKAAGSSGATESIWSELFSARMYKPTQGRIARQVTGGAIWVAFAVCAWRWWESAYGIKDLSSLFSTGDTANVIASWLRWVLPGLLLGVGMWIGYRVVNYPRFADFLIAVEAEMNKVMWPSQDELIRSSLVVIVLLLAFAALMFVFDFVWVWLFQLIGVRPPAGPSE
jgi:preprotein translocase subunit SecE